MARVFVGIGSNIEPSHNVRAGALALAARTRLRRLSTVYRTPALGERRQPAFYNVVAEVETDLTAEGLKQELRAIEAGLGRVRSADKWASRTIDLDVLLFADQDGLQPPAPEIRERAFLSAALAELAPDLPLPDGARLAEVARAVPPWPMEPLYDYTRRLREELSLASS